MEEKNKNKKEGSILADIPLGLSSALSRNIDAMRVFAQMPDEERKSVIDGARTVSSKSEMRAYVEELTFLSRKKR